MEAISLGTQDSAYVTSTEAFNTVRGGGLGSSAYVAQIVGNHPKYHFEREFLSAEKNLSDSGRSGSMTWAIGADGLYELAKFCTSSTSEMHGKVYVLRAGREVSEIQVSVAKMFVNLDSASQAKVIELVSEGRDASEAVESVAPSVAA